jgi:hypothetical protein
VPFRFSPESVQPRYTEPLHKPPSWDREEGV